MRFYTLKKLPLLPVYFFAVSVRAVDNPGHESQTDKFEEAYTRRSTVQAGIGQFEGIFEENKFELDSKSVILSFIFSSTPGVFIGCCRLGWSDKIKS